VDKADGKTGRLARQEKKRVIRDFDALVETTEIVRHHTGMSCYRVGIYPRLRKLLDSITRVKGLYIVGDCFGHSALETVIRSARRATDAVLRSACGAPGTDLPTVAPEQSCLPMIGD